MVFIDKSGMIRAQYEGRDDMLKEGTQEKTVRDKIQEIINLPAPAPTKSGAGKKTTAKKS